MYRILIADDEPIERMVVAKKVTKFFPEQFELVQVENGREVLEMFDKNPCHIALLDIEMPGVNGLEAAEQLRKQNQECEIIFLTAFDEFHYAKKAISVRAIEYLLKPVNEEELITAIEEAVNRIEEREALIDKATGKRKSDLENLGTTHTEGASEDVLSEDDTLNNVRLHAIAEHIRTYVEMHYQEDVSVQDVAGLFHYSDAYFCKIFKQCFEKSFIVYLSELRIEKAKELLADVSVNVKDISTRVGYRDSNYFTKVFKRNTGETPSEYRIRCLKQEV